MVLVRFFSCTFKYASARARVVGIFDIPHNMISPIREITAKYA